MRVRRPSLDSIARTNVEVVKDIMSASRLAQMFVIDALFNWSEKIAACKPEDVDTPMIHGKAWVDVAKEIHDKLSAAYDSEGTIVQEKLESIFASPRVVAKGKDGEVVARKFGSSKKLIIH